MKIIEKKILLIEIKKMAEETFGNLVKAVVDVEKKIMVVDGELHSDEESILIESGSEQKNLWGINLYPNEKFENLIEFDSLINLKPFHGNLSRSVNDPEIRKQISEIVYKLIEK